MWKLEKKKVWRQRNTKIYLCHLHYHKIETNMRKCSHDSNSEFEGFLSYISARGEGVKDTALLNNVFRLRDICLGACASTGEEEKV